ncbi:restriction endonuclease subunit S [Empedobacter falsenii]|uniref:restriction endonuclease subunit S n=1 Tax=Empedobacter falsenii TaxID=343874 RepID=UPI003A7FD56D
MSYKKLGGYIQQVNVRNRDLEVETLLGVSNTKKMIPSIANTIGTDMSSYKIIEKRQFAYGTITSRNGDRLSVAISDQYDKALVSQIYIVFEVIDDNDLLPEYLMMWFSRPEFDRYARFKSHGSTRESFDWEELCEVELPIPSIEKQREIVAQYQAVANKIKVNEQICEKLEATAQALYKQWFVDFEFPNENGKPYKSSGGATVFNEELEKQIPEGWAVKKLEDIIECKDGTHDSPKEVREGNKLITSMHINKFDIDLNNAYSISEIDFIQVNKRSKVDYGDILVSMIGTVGNVNLVTYRSIDFAIKNLGLIKTSKYLEFRSFLYLFLNSIDFKIYLESELNGSTQKYITLSFIRNIRIVYNQSLIDLFNDKIFQVFEEIINKVNQNQKLTQLQSLLLSRLATLEG